jgi:hypothetical protein
MSVDHGRLWSEAYRYIQGIKNLALHHHDFIRPIQNWMPSGVSKRKIFASLVNHLLAEYQMPFFMSSIWLKETDDTALQQQGWYIKMSRGASIRRLDIPALMTRKMEHLFLQSPDHFSLEEAICYSQVLGLGGKKGLAKAVVATRMGRHLENDDFWRSVINFFINAKDLKRGYVNPIVDFLYHIKFSREEVNSDKGVIITEPSQPDFSMKGRTFNSIMRLVENWHKELSMGNGKSGFRWEKSRFNDFRYLEESYDSEHKRRIWRITELLSSADLVVEGSKMRHCVRSYASRCFHGKSTIWSMKREVKENIKRVMTIEVDPSSRVIRQARGRFNHAPNKKAMEIMKKWANREGLKIGLHM